MSRSIYVMRSEYGPVKVGIATNINKRLTALRIASPVDVSLKYAAVADGNVAALEKRAHEILARNHMRGEWFRVEVDEAVKAVVQAALELGLSLQPANVVIRDGRGRPATGQAPNMVVRVDSETRAAVMSLLARGERPSDFLRTAIQQEIARRRG